MNKILSITLVLALVVTSIVLFSTKENTTALPPEKVTGTAQVGGAFTLTGTDGKAVNDTQFRGKYMLVFFGFTRCPDVCPTTLATITSAMGQLGDKASRIVPVFITVDPKNDTPDVIKTYLANFDPHVVGLTGTEEQIKAAASAYKAYYAEAAPAKKEHGGHGAHGGHDEKNAIDHSAFLYLMDTQGQYIMHFPYTVAPDALARSLKEKMQ